MMKKLQVNHELHQVVSNHSANVDFGDFKEICREPTKQLSSVLVIDATQLVQYDSNQ